MQNNPLLQLRELGQSVWCDNIRRGTINGELARMVEAGEITGLTSNPTIFEKAITGSTDYDDDLRRLAEAGKSATEIYEALAVDDIRAVADLLRPTYDRTARRDGYTSFEVSPKLAHDTEASLSEAKRFFAWIARENVMIKIPGTSEGMPAIEQATTEGVNINVTLLFSIESYEQSARAYIRGLERRAEAGKPIHHVASVASFFVSRVDTAVDAALEERIAQGAADLQELLGKAAIANARLAYQRFKAIFSEPPFMTLVEKGAMVQRPLWGSTSTKNPRYSDVLYVEELVGMNTVNTMPPATIDAFRDHGNAALSIERDLPGAEETFRRLAAAGLDLNAITLKLQQEGVDAFADSFDKLIAAIEQKRKKLLAPAA